MNVTHQLEKLIINSNEHTFCKVDTENTILKNIS